MEKKNREQSIKDLTLALMYLTRFNEKDRYRYMEMAWTGYDFEVIDELDEEDLLIHPERSRGNARYAYLTQAGAERARKLLGEFGMSDKDICERFAFREVVPEDIPQIIEIEQICFPSNEACKPDMMRSRAETAFEIFLVAVDKTSGKLAGFLNGIATNEYVFRDEFFTDSSLHQKDGECIMLCGLDVLPQYRKQGLARELVYTYCRRERERGRKRLVLTCLENKVKMYRKFGFIDRGLSASNWGDEQWHEMDITLNY